MIFLILSVLSNRDLQVLSKIKNLPILILTLITTYVVSYVMKYLWLDLKTGNANFLFFQGLCMWVAYGLFIIEYIKAMINNVQDSTPANEAGEKRLK
jgi:ABC-type amino acid transport system permease subunit